MRISLLLLILFAAIAGGCKIAQEVTDGEPGTLLGKGFLKLLSRSCHPTGRDRRD